MDMKKINLTILIAAASLAAASCSGFLDTVRTDAVSTGNMWTDESKADAGMAGIYYPLYKTNLTRTQIRMEDYDGLNRTGMEGNGFTSDEYSTNYPLQYLYRSTKQAMDFQGRLEWQIIFRLVHDCNDAVANLGRAGLSEEKYNRYLCEARLLRAWAYSRLNMIYGGVPLYLEPVTNEECNRVQSSFVQVWQAVIDDCTFAIENANCPNNTLTSNYGRPSKGLAYSLRGMAYMWLAAIVPDGVNHPFKSGIITDPSDVKLSETEYYTLAEADFAKVEECGYGLWQGKWGDFFTEKNEKSKEMIFPLQFTTDPGFCHNWQQVIGCTDQYIGWQQLKPSADFVNTFQKADGTPFRWSDVPGLEDWDAMDVTAREVFFIRDGMNDVEAKVEEYDALIKNATDEEEIARLNSEKLVYTELRTRKEECIKRIGQENWNKYYLNSGNEARIREAYEHRDPRLEQAVITPYQRLDSYSPYSEPQKVLKKVLRWPVSVQDNTKSETDLYVCYRNTLFYVWKKYNVLDDSLPGGTQGRQRCGYDWPLVRFTQVLLQRAEALVHLGREGDAKALVDQVRSRAGMPGVTASGKEAMLEAIRYETRIELCEEGVNYFDEIRWGTYKDSKFQGKDVHGGTNVWGDMQYEYKWYYTDTMWPWSISDREAQKNPNLIRRDGWLY